MTPRYWPDDVKARVLELRKTKTLNQVSIAEGVPVPTIRLWERQSGKVGQRGTAAMSEDDRRAVAGKGGAAVLAKYGPDFFRNIGKKGGETVSQDKAHMSRIGTLGGGKAKGPRKEAPCRNADNQGEHACADAEEHKMRSKQEGDANGE